MKKKIKAKTNVKKNVKKNVRKIEKRAKKIARKVVKNAKRFLKTAKKAVHDVQEAARQPGNRVSLKFKPAKIDVVGKAWVIHNPRFGEEGTHFHTLGLLTPYFEGLTKGKLLATKCVNPSCPIYHGQGELWLPPRADCPDCHQPMKWEEIPSPNGYIYAYTNVARGGTGLELETPYFQIDVKMPGVCSIVKGYLVDRKPIKIGDKVRAKFLTGNKATHTCLDIYWELV